MYTVCGVVYVIPVFAAEYVVGLNATAYALFTVPLVAVVASITVWPCTTKKPSVKSDALTA